MDNNFNLDRIVQLQTMEQLFHKSFKTSWLNWRPLARREKRAWEHLAEIRWVLKDATGIKLPPPARTTTDLKGQALEKWNVMAARRSGIDNSV